MSRRSFFCLAALLLAACPVLHVHAAPRRPMTFADLMAMKRVGGPVPSPDGKWVAFEQTDVDLAANTKTPHLWIVPAEGGDARRLNPGSDHPESRPRFSPDGKRLLFTAKAGEGNQIWMVGFDPAEGKTTGLAHPLTNLSTSADGAIWSPDGKNVVFVSSVYPEAEDDAANRGRGLDLEASEVKAQLFTRLFFRHWASFTDFKRSHLFVVDANTNAYFVPSRTGSIYRDLTPGDHDVPPFSLGGQDDYAISPDGRELAYTSNVDEVEAASTNNEIFMVPLAGGTPKKLSTSPGSDSTPIYSPDGKYLAWRSQARAGFESDKQSLLLYDRVTGTVRNATEKFDRSVEEFAWTPDSSAVFFVAENYGQSPIYALEASGKASDLTPVMLVNLHAGDLAFAREGYEMFFSQTKVMLPGEIACLKLTCWSDVQMNRMVKDEAHAKAITHVNAPLLSQLDLAPWESFTFRSTDGSEVQGFLLRPPGFDASKKYPVKFLVHGGPQGAWGDSWSYRWNPELMAADGYVVVAVNPHGSTGYG